MIGRQSVWSDERVIELAKKFVATTDKVYRLQTEDDPEALFFQSLAKDGHYRGRKGKTQQGIYVVSPGGQLLASINSTSADYVLRIMQQGLENWRKLPADQRRLSDESKINPEHRWEDSYQPDGLDLTSVARDLPWQLDPNTAAEEKWNLGRVWFSQQEARQWLPENIEEGVTLELPRKLAYRLVQFNLLDTVKGETPHFNARDVQLAKIEVKVKSVSGTKIDIEISGSTRAESRFEWTERKAYPHGVATSLLGYATFDTQSEKFISFEMVALGKRWGRTTYNDRTKDSATNPLGYVFRLTAPDAAVVAPTNLANYEVDWVKFPN